MTAAPESAEAASDGASEAAPSDIDATVEVSTVVPHPVERVWRTLITQEGTEALLGPGAALGGKGEPWRSKEGPHGVMRSYHPLEQVRLSWHADDDAPTSMVDLQLRPEGASTRLDLRHQHIGADDTTHLQQRWSDALQRVNEATG